MKDILQNAGAIPYKLVESFTGDSNKVSELNTIVAPHYRFGEKIGSGTYGDVYQSEDKKYAIKVSKSAYDLETIQLEMAYYKAMNMLQIGPEFPAENNLFVVAHKTNSDTTDDSASSPDTPQHKGLYIIVMKHYNSDLKEYLKNVAKVEEASRLETLMSQLNNRLEVNINRMLKFDLLCLDNKPANLLVSYDSASLKMDQLIFTDFGIKFCCNIHKYREGESKFCIFMKEHKSEYPRYKEFVKDLVVVVLCLMSFEIKMVLQPQFRAIVSKYTNDSTYKSDLTRFYQFVCKPLNKKVCNHLRGLEHYILKKLPVLAEAFGDSDLASRIAVGDYKMEDVVKRSVDLLDKFIQAQQQQQQESDSNSSTM